MSECRRMQMVPYLSPCTTQIQVNQRSQQQQQQK